MPSGIPTDLIARARMLLQSGRLADAGDLCAQACALDKENMEAWLMLGTLQGATGDVATGLTTLGRALELAPGNPRVQLARAKLLLLKGNDVAALHACNTALGRDPGLVEGWLLLGMLQLWQDDFISAETSARQVLMLQPGLPAGRLLLANACGGQDKTGDTADENLARPILVTGLPRSGTSLVAGSLQACGAWLGKTLAGNTANPEGYFENAAIREGLVKAILLQAQADPLGVRELPALSALPLQPSLGGQVLNLLMQQGYTGAETWLYKDAKLSLLWPLWRRVFPFARWVLVRRQPEDIIASCLRTDFMRQHSQDSEFWAGWVRAYEQRLDMLKACGAWWREVEAAQLLSEGALALRPLVDELDLEWNAAKVEALIKPRHWHAPVATRDVAVRHTAAGPVRVLANSIPKSGTHLLGKALALMGVTEVPVRLYNSVAKPGNQTGETTHCVPVGSIWPGLVPIERLGELLLQAGPGAFIQGHLPHAERVACLLELLNYRMVLIIRDPRAVALSHAGWVPTREYLPSYEFYQDKTPGERLALAITGYRVEPDGPLELGLRQRFEHLLPWMAHPLVYTTRFERLAGPQSGGDREAQLQELRNIADHLGLRVSGERLLQVADKLHGGTMTFRKGRIDRWREAFTGFHKDLINKEMGDLVVKLGYESGIDWSI